MQSFGRFLQLVGLMLVPMALVFYFGLHGTVSERRLLAAELSILGVGAGVFLLGNRLVKK